MPETEFGEEITRRLKQQRLCFLQRRLAENSKAQQAATERRLRVSHLSTGCFVALWLDLSTPLRVNMHSDGDTPHLQPVIKNKQWGLILMKTCSTPQQHKVT